MKGYLVKVKGEINSSMVVNANDEVEAIEAFKENLRSDGYTKEQIRFSQYEILEYF